MSDENKMNRALLARDVLLAMLHGTAVDFPRPEQVAYSAVQTADALLMRLGPPQQNDVTEKSIATLELSNRVNNALASRDVRTVGDLLKMSPADVLKTRNMGRGSLQEIRAALLPYGLYLAAQEQS